ncbi:MAG: MBL fold metallo-hydrolase [Anaerolineae bacterium]|nr:MBL fold metallo-hydrolase [Anaerolineae bacterium]
MKKITDGIYWVEGLLVGRVYVIESADGLTVIDATIPNAVKRIAQEIASIGHSLTDVKRILITHAHPDHIGSLAALQQATNAAVYVHPNDVGPVRGENIPMPVPASLTGLARVLGSLMPPTKMAAATVQREIREGDVLDEVLPGLTVLEVFGHSPGQVAFWYPAKHLLFCGDVAMHLLGMRLPMAVATVNMAQAKQSIQRIAALDTDIVCFGHGDPIIGGAAAALRTFAAKVAP